MRTPLRLPSLCLLSVGLVVAGCPGGESDGGLAALALEEHCQPLLAGQDCMLPYPSDYFRVADDTMPTGGRIEILEPAKLYTDDGYSADVNDLKPIDGYSTTSPIVALLGEPVADRGLVHIFDDPAPTLSASSKTLLLDVARGELVPHFVDLDPRTDDDARRAIVIRPHVGLTPGARYVVALQGLENADGAAAKRPEGFARLADGTVDADPALAALADRYGRDVFAPLEALGVSRDALQLAWDFTVGSDEHTLKDLLDVRAAALAALDAEEPVVTIDAVFEDDEGSFRTVRGTVTSPMFLDSVAAGASVARDEDGAVVQDGVVAVPFTAVVPYSVRDSFAPGRAMLFGHGFFGSRFELEGSATRTMCDEFHAVCVAVDWWGMSDEDLAIVLPAMASDVSQSMQFGDRVPQAMVNFIAVARAMKGGAFAATAAFQRPTDPLAPGVVEDPANPGVTNAGASLIDGSHVDFFGISQGHILGGVQAAVNPELEKIILHVGGAGFTQMMFRANPFKRFLFILEYQILDPLDVQKMAATMAPHFDRFDPARVARYVLRDELPWGPPGGREHKQVLLSYAQGDTSVPNFASVLHARLLGLPHLTPSPRPAYVIDTVESGAAPSAAAGFATPLDDSFYAVADPPEEVNAVHNDARTTPEVLAQMKAFLDDGVVIDPCTGPCVLDIPTE